MATTIFTEFEPVPDPGVCSEAQEHSENLVNDSGSAIDFTDDSEGAE